ncbi:MAG: copper chaperone [Rhodothermales bacterium]|jgi:copper chaperone
MKHQLIIEGMSCQHCVHAVKEALASVDDLTVEGVEIGTAHVEGTDDALERAKAAIEDDGYTVVAVR